MGNEQGEKEAMLARKKEGKLKAYDTVYSITDAVERFEYALELADFLERQASEKAIICTSLVWLYRDLRDQRSEMQYMQMAVKYFILAIQNEKPPYSGYDEGRVKLIVGEFFRRLGKKEEARRWIANVILDPLSLPQHKERGLEIKELLM